MPHELPKSYEPGAIETRWAEYWVKEKLFSVPTPPEGETRPVFMLLLPPPNVTGRLHMGHMLNQTQMDIVVRWHRMRGFITLWLPGTDHAGIATQMMVERQLAKEGKKRRDLGREKFIERVWDWKQHYGGAILDQMKRLGASVDWDREYFTMDDNLSRAVREVFVRLYEEGLIYRGKYIVNWCPRCETAISDLEVKHEEVAGKLWEIRYPIVGSNEYITVATTRPETMLGDTAIAVNPKDERYTHVHGKKALLPLMNREIPIITDELAQPEFGTGAVKVTPAHDPNDFQAGKRHNLPQIDVMDEHAHMNANAGPYRNLDRYEARKLVLDDLKEQGFLVGEKDYTLALGKCDRCGTVVEPRLSEQWFIKIKPLADRAKEAVESGAITIVPENYRQVYLNWMTNIYDWCISRQLWWGHRIPAWTCESCNEVIVAREVPTQCPKCGKGKLEQVSDVLDTWFSSGLLPFTTLGWPERTRDLDVFYPNTLMITGFDILFFWLARMIMFGCHFMQGHEQDPMIKSATKAADAETSAYKDDSVPFRHVYIHALVRDAERQKMSKTKGNVLDPLEIIERFGTDATRFTLAAMAAPGTDIAFNESRTEGYRAFANKIWNAARFMFMNVDRLDPNLWRARAVSARLPNVAVSEDTKDLAPMTLEDRWILSRLNRTLADVDESLEGYRFNDAANRTYDFFWGDLCDWYIELIKPRLTSNVGTESEIASEMLVAVFDAALRLLHPIMPFITEEIWHAMYDGAPPTKSIAMAPFPEIQQGQVDLSAETQMAILQDLIASVRNIRAELKLENKLALPIEVFSHEPSVWILIQQNEAAIKRLANVASITEVAESYARKAPSRSTARFDVRLLYEREINIETECARLRRELQGLEKPIEVAAFQLGNQNFLSKAPKKVVDGVAKQLDELKLLKTKLLAALKELGCE
ncbi:MAG: valine--tRNA ligase [Candidatus Sulfotelmatobacter sp.]